MGFDFQNFGLGLLAGWISAYGVYRARHRLGRLVESGQAGAQSARAYATRSADGRYINELTRLADRTHLAGEFVRLSDILIEPRFLPHLPLTPLDDDDEITRDVYEVVPRIHDHPFLHAPYHLETLSIDELGEGDRALALLGPPGSGRTTALLAIALHSLGQVRFKPPVDKVQQRIDAEEAALTDKERASRKKERLMIEERARERLADERGADFDEAGEASHQLPVFRRLMPVYVHVGDVDINTTEFGSEIDPAEPLVRAVQYRIGGIAARALPRNLYKRLGRGQVLLLIDGYDDLPDDEQAVKRVWLSALLEQYRDNTFIVTGPATGYGQLTRLGLTPVWLRPWTDADTDRAAEVYADMWARLSGQRQRGAKRPAQAVVTRAKINNRALYPAEVALKLWANYVEDTTLPGIEGWLRAYVARHLSDNDVETLLPQVAQMARLQIDEGFITSARLQELAIGGATETGETGEAAGDDDKKKTADSETTTSQGRLLGMLRRGGLLVRYRSDRYQFRHPLIAAYLASLTLRDAAPAELVEKAHQPRWSPVLGYAALHTNIAHAVKARLDAPPDILHTQALDAARWLAYAGSDASYRGAMLKRLGNLLTAPSQYPYLRERAAAALVSTRDPSIQAVFRRALRLDNPLVRALSCLAIGAAAGAESLRDLSALLRDQDASVQLAAAMGLSAIPDDSALETMVVEFTQGSEKVQQALAIAFAAMPDEGYPILYDASSDPDMLLRRAAIFGLKRLRTDWAFGAIFRAFLEDEQWYVRSAAQQAFQEMQYGRERSLTATFPPAESLTWLAQWAATRGENVPPGDGANQMLLRALQEGDPDTRARSAATIGQLGLAETTRPLYAALSDKQDDVREAAHRSLAELDGRIGGGLPAPV